MPKKLSELSLISSVPDSALLPVVLYPGGEAETVVATKEDLFTGVTLYGATSIQTSAPILSLKGTAGSTLASLQATPSHGIIIGANGPLMQVTPSGGVGFGIPIGGTLDYTTAPAYITPAGVYHGNGSGLTNVAVTNAPALSNGVDSIVLMSGGPAGKRWQATTAIGSPYVIADYLYADELAATGQNTAIMLYGRTLMDASGMAASLNWDSRELIDADFGYPSLNWNYRELCNEQGWPLLTWRNNGVNIWGAKGGLQELLAIDTEFLTLFARDESDYTAVPVFSWEMQDNPSYEDTLYFINASGKLVGDGSALTGITAEFNRMVGEVAGGGTTIFEWDTGTNRWSLKDASGDEVAYLLPDGTLSVKDIIADSLTAVTQQRYETAADLSSLVLLPGEIAIASDTKEVFVGDGVTEGGFVVAPKGILLYDHAVADGTVDSAGTAGTAGIIAFHDKAVQLAGGNGGSVGFPAGADGGIGGNGGSVFVGNSTTPLPLFRFVGGNGGNHSSIFTEGNGGNGGNLLQFRAMECQAGDGGSIGGTRRGKGGVGGNIVGPIISLIAGTGGEYGNLSPVASGAGGSLNFLGTGQTYPSLHGAFVIRGGSGGMMGTANNEVNISGDGGSVGRVLVVKGGNGGGGNTGLIGGNGGGRGNYNDPILLFGGGDGSPASATANGGNGGSFGYIRMVGGNGGKAGTGVKGGDGGNAGSINLSGGNASSAQVDGGSGGMIVMTGTVGYSSGSIWMSGGEDGNGGSLVTANGGGSIDTKEGTLELGVAASRTTLQKTSTFPRTINLPDKSGTLVTRPAPQAFDLAGTNDLIYFEDGLFLSITLTANGILDLQGSATIGSQVEIFISNPDGYELSFAGSGISSWFGADPLPTIPPDGAYVTIKQMTSTVRKAVWDV